MFALANAPACTLSYTHRVALIYTPYRIPPRWVCQLAKRRSIERRPIIIWNSSSTHASHSECTVEFLLKLHGILFAFSLKIKRISVMGHESFHNLFYRWIQSRFTEYLRMFIYREWTQNVDVEHCKRNVYQMDTHKMRARTKWLHVRRGAHVKNRIQLQTKSPHILPFRSLVCSPFHSVAIFDSLQSTSHAHT